MREILSDPVSMKYLPMLYKEWTMEEVIARRESQVKGKEEGTAEVLYVLSKSHDGAEEELMGPSGYLRMRDGQASAGIILAPEYWGKGLGTEVFYYLLEYGFEGMKLDRIVYETLETNSGMRGWLEKVCRKQVDKILYGRVSNDQEYNEYIYTLYKEEWPEIKKRIAAKMAQGNK